MTGRIDSSYGALVVVYGVNNLGKTTQIKEHIIPFLRERGLEGRYVKYPDYTLVPSGPLINSYLRSRNSWGSLRNPFSFSAREMQLLNVLNRTQKEPEILEYLGEGEIVVAEDYTGGGIAWGRAAGVDEELLEYWNGHLLEPDLCLLFVGERFSEGVEASHVHENMDGFVSEAEEELLSLAAENDWVVVDAEGSEEAVFSRIRPHLEELLPVRQAQTAPANK